MSDYTISKRDFESEKFQQVGFEQRGSYNFFIYLIEFLDIAISVQNSAV